MVADWPWFLENCNTRRHCQASHTSATACTLHSFMATAAGCYSDGYGSSRHTLQPTRRANAVICFFDTAQGKAQGHVLQHPSDIVAVSLNQQGIAPDRQVLPHNSLAQPLCQDKASVAATWQQNLELLRSLQGTKASELDANSEYGSACYQLI